MLKRLARTVRTKHITLVPLFVLSSMTHPIRHQGTYRVGALERVLVPRSDIYNNDHEA